ncbi:MAG TPA: DUF4129 domain-containing protein [Stackebrandtia sp.]|jgi:hypothetical protein|uniref:DUF4129 domain-containing protein n=1 Tax=Stackebrandtia sp. TaxID=2023065 RepID=UPI002D4573FA|nr:DUF4129 domain-containing protein [Stackebrandtia sp.]HZE39586.1 DUF4129 domain-containing protein [Stackebrandtia sp.]
MTLLWTQIVANVADWFPGGLYMLGLVVLLIGLAVGLALQPFGLWRWRARFGRDKAKPAEPVIVADANEEALPDLPSDALLARAQRFMAAGQYRLAVREWLRVMVRDLVERSVVENHPGWTVTELASAAGRALPTTAVTLDEAGRIFSEIWYGGYDADANAAGRMRDLHAQLAAAVAGHHPVAMFSLEAT